ncbi:MAG: lanthionine synthetase C family protein [Armatimonadota bacterium]
MLSDGAFRSVRNILVERIADYANCVIGDADKVQFLDCSMSRGLTGVAFTIGQCAELREDPSLGELAAKLLRFILSSTSLRQWRLSGLFDGLAGVAFCASKTPFYCNNTSLLEQLDRRVGALAGKQMQAIAEVGSDGLRAEMWDLISGLSGIALSRIGRNLRGEQQDELVGWLTLMVKLAESDGSSPSWKCYPFQTPDAYLRESFPSGLLNCGLAHGVAGMLGTLSIARVAGYELIGMDRAIDKLANWLAGQVIYDSYGPSWPSAVHLEPAEETTIPTRSAWCYGPAGIAAVLLNASIVTGDRALENLARTTLKAILLRSLCERRTPSPTFCHGYSGFLLILKQLSERWDDESLQGGLHLELERILTFIDASQPFCYRDESGDPAGIGLLDGLSGILLSIESSLSVLRSPTARLFCLQ